MSVLRILAFDPAITDMGWAYILFDTEKKIYVVQESGVIHGNKLTAGMQTYQKRFQKSFMTSMKMYDAVVDLIFKFRPQYIASEGAFYSKYPQAWASLSIVIHTLRRAWYYTIEASLTEAVNKTMGDDVYLVAPMETKKIITGKGMADKDQMKAGVLAYKNLYIKSPNKKNLAEHEYDAIGHGVTFCLLRLPDIQKEEQKRMAAYQLVLKRKEDLAKREQAKKERLRILLEKRQFKEAEKKRKAALRLLKQKQKKK